MRQMRFEASAAIGMIIKIGQELLSEDTRNTLNEIFLPFVISHLPNIHFRVQKLYSLMLSVSSIVSTVIICVRMYI